MVNTSKIQDKLYRTNKILIKPMQEINTYFDTVSRSALKLCCNANQLIMDCYLSFDDNSPLDTPKLHSVAEDFNTYVDAINALCENAYRKKLVQWKKKNIPPKVDGPKVFDPLSKRLKIPSYSMLEAYYKVTKNKLYYDIPHQLNQQLIREIRRNWSHYFLSLREYKKSKSKYKAPPQMPTIDNCDYKTLIFTGHICRVKKDGTLKFPRTDITLNIAGLVKKRPIKIHQVKVKHINGCFEVHIISCIDKPDIKNKLDKNKIISIDLGVKNFVTIANNFCDRPIIFNGKPIKSINYNYLHNKKDDFAAENNIRKPLAEQYHNEVNNKRRNRINDYLHKVSKYIIDYCLSHNCGQIIIGKNNDWKYKPKMHKKAKRDFCLIPHTQFINMLKYKSEICGIEVVLQEESYTSKASFLDNDTIPTYGNTSATRL